MRLAEVELRGRAVLHELGPPTLDGTRENLLQQVGTRPERDEFEHPVLLHVEFPASARS